MDDRWHDMTWHGMGLSLLELIRKEKDELIWWRLLLVHGTCMNDADHQTHSSRVGYARPFHLAHSSAASDIRRQRRVVS